MGKFNGSNAAVSFGGTAYGCLDKYDFSGSNNVAKGSCSGPSGAVMHKTPGASDYTVSFDHLVESQDTTTLNAFLPGTTGALELHPEGDATGNIEATAANAIVASMRLGGSIGSNSILSITLEIDGTPTFAAAS